MTNNHFSTSYSVRQRSNRLILSLGITLVFVLFELVGGYLANSLALLTDAAHNFTDVLTLGLSWLAVRLALKPATSNHTYGFHRAGILIALVNSVTLIGVSGFVGLEAYQRFQEPQQVHSLLMSVTSGIAFLVNIVTALLIRHGSQTDLNLRSAYLHLMGDVFSTLGAFLAGVLIYFTGYVWLDPLVSLVIVALILWNALKIVAETVQILLEGAPRDINVEQLVEELRRVPGVDDVHDVHVWSITAEVRSLSAHIVTGDISLSEGALIQQRIAQLLRQRYAISHATLQLECKECEPALLYCDLNLSNSR
ncbi:MAG: cation diffusion facilitator family transporter [Anaerolineales bacterium]|nr:cation diffusion facilitator family transporter [Anaerolineales bacterium]MDW8161128.1 cation diffusion facilitator family transporter [Anaerolineales bacterium]